MTKSFRVLFLGLPLVAACAHPARPAATTPPPAVANETAAALPERASYEVPADARFDVALLQPLGTRVNAPGDAFRARVLTPLTSPSGRVVVAFGAVVIGRIVTVDRAPVARLRLKLDAIETVNGPVPLRATMAPLQRSPSFVALPPAADDAECDAVLHAATGIPVIGSFSDPSDGRDAEGTNVRANFRLPRQTQLQLVLREPLRLNVPAS